MSALTLSRTARDLAIEKALDAAIEINDVIRGTRNDAPALLDLVLTLMGAWADGGIPEKRELFGDSQTVSLYRRAASVDPLEILKLFVRAHSLGLPSLSKSELEDVRKFCLGLNRELLAEAFSRIPESPFARSGTASLALNAD